MPKSASPRQAQPRAANWVWKAEAFTGGSIIAPMGAAIFGEMI